MADVTNDVKMMRATRREQAIAAGALRQYRMRGTAIAPKRGKGVAYKRPKAGGRGGWDA